MHLKGSGSSTFFYLFSFYSTVFLLFSAPIFYSSILSIFEFIYILCVALIPSNFYYLFGSKLPKSTSIVFSDFFLAG